MNLEEMKLGGVVYSPETGLTRICCATPEKQCELCGETAELRPYGPNGENICFECGMIDEKATEAQFAKRLAGIDTLAVILTDPQEDKR